jgi:RNA polymerase sigma-70 factor (ECF subfamily)
MAVMTAFATVVEEVEGALEKARRGDHDAFASIVGEHESMVFSVAYHFFNDRGRAADIAQDVFLKLYRSLPEIESAGHLTNWLRQVTARRCIDALRRSRFPFVSLEAAEHVATPAGGSDPFLERRIRSCIAGLPARQRLLVTLRYQEDLGPNEISEAMGIPVNTVKSHLHRALQTLRRKLETL